MLKTNQLLFYYFYKCAFIIEEKKSIKDTIGGVLEISFSPGISCVNPFLCPAASHWDVPEKWQTQECWGPFPDTPRTCLLCTASPRLAWLFHNLQLGLTGASLLQCGVMDKAAAAGSLSTGNFRICCNSHPQSKRKSEQASLESPGRAAPSPGRMLCLAKN